MRWKIAFVVFLMALSAVNFSTALWVLVRSFDRPAPVFSPALPRQRCFPSGTEGTDGFPLCPDTTAPRAA